MSSTPSTHKPKKSITLPLLLILVPGALIILSIIGYAVMNFVLGQALGGAEGSAAEGGGIIRVVINVLLFLLGAGGLISFVPCLIIGIILLVTRK